MVPRSTAETSLKAPPKVPMAVRQPERMTTSSLALITDPRRAGYHPAFALPRRQEPPRVARPHEPFEGGLDVRGQVLARRPSLVRVHREALQVAEHDVDDVVAADVGTGVIVEGDLGRGDDHLHLRPSLAERARVRRSMYGFCTAMTR